MALKELIRHSAIYGISDSLTRVIGFVLIPLYTRVLTTGEYGIYDVLLATLTALKIFLSLNLGSALFREILLSKRFSERTLISTALLTILTLAIGASIVLYLNADWIAATLLTDEKYAALITFLVVALLAELARDIPMNLLRIYNKSLQFGLVNVVGFLAQMIVNVLLLAVWEWKVEGLLLGIIVSRSLMVVLAAYFTGIHFPRRFSFRGLGSLLTFSLPLVPTSLSLFILNLSDRYLMLHLRGPEETGVYSLGYKLGGAFFIIVEAFQLAWPRFLYSKAKEEPQSAPAFYATVLRLLVLAICVPGMLAALFAEELVQLIAREAFYPAADYIAPVILAAIFYGMFYGGAVGVNLMKRTYLIMLSVGFGAVLNLGLNLLLIPRWGGLAAAWTTAVSFAVMSGLTIWFSVRLYPVPYEWRRMVSVMGLIIMILLSLEIFGSANLYVSILLKLGAYLCGMFAIWKLGLDTDERNRILSVTGLKNKLE